MEEALRQSGFATLNIDYASRKKNRSRRLLRTSIRPIAALRGGTRRFRFHFVAPLHGRLAWRGVYLAQTSAGAARPRGHARHTQWRQRGSPIS